MSTINITVSLDMYTRKNAISNLKKETEPKITILQQKILLQTFGTPVNSRKQRIILNELGIF